MHALKKIAFNNIKHRASNFSIGGLVDLALLTNKRIALSVSQNQYIELLGTYGLLLNHQKVVLIGDKEMKERVKMETLRRKFVNPNLLNKTCKKSHR